MGAAQAPDPATATSSRGRVGGTGLVHDGEPTTVRAGDDRLTVALLADADDNMVYVEITMTALDASARPPSSPLTSDEAQCLANALQRRT